MTGAKQVPADDLRVVSHPDPQALASAVAARLITAALDAISVRGRADLVLTGGGAGIAALAAVPLSPAASAVDWEAVHVWWGDERFLPAGDPDRNATQARAALGEAIRIPTSNVHEMPAADERSPDVDVAAARYAEELSREAEQGSPAPAFDVLMLGIGPDGHVASLFPGHPALDHAGASVVGVRKSPKPPPLRVSLTMPTIRSAQRVWLIASGAGKARAVERAQSHADIHQCPAAHARGRLESLLLADEDALGSR